MDELKEFHRKLEVLAGKDLEETDVERAIWLMENMDAVSACAARIQAKLTERFVEKGWQHPRLEVVRLKGRKRWADGAKERLVDEFGDQVLHEPKEPGLKGISQLKKEGVVPKELIDDLTETPEGELILALCGTS